MSVIITNVSDHDGSERPSEYVVRINNGPVLGRFEHMRQNGLAACLRLAADSEKASVFNGRRSSFQFRHLSNDVIISIA